VQCSSKLKCDCLFNSGGMRHAVIRLTIVIIVIMNTVDKTQL